MSKVNRHSYSPTLKEYKKEPKSRFTLELDFKTPAASAAR